MVGYNSHNADVPIIIQRSIVNGLFGEGLGERPDKPWEGVDYFAQSGDFNIDLAPILGRYAQTPKLNIAFKVRLTFRDFICHQLANQGLLALVSFIA